MADQHPEQPDAEMARDLEALPAELHPLYQRLADDGAVWQAASAEKLAPLAQSLATVIERMASDGSQAARADDVSALAPIEASGRAHASTQHTQRRAWLVGAFAVVAATVVVGLLALVLQGALAGRGTANPPNDQRKNHSGQWQVLDKLSVNSSLADGPPLVIAPSDTRVVYELAHLTTGSAEAGKVVIYDSLRRTEDGGETWTTLTLPLPVVDITNITIRVSPLRAQTVFLTLWDRSSAPCNPTINLIGEGCARGYVSTDAGDTWQQQTLPVQGILNSGGAIVAQDGRLYASNACSDDTCVHLLMSTDGGLTWRVADAQITASRQHICDLAASASGQSVYAVVSPAACDQSLTKQTIWRSDDTGAHWFQVGPLLPQFQTRHYVLLFGSALLTAPGTGQPDVLYLNMPYLNAAASPIFLYSEDRGATWKSTPPIPVTRKTKYAYPELPVIGKATVLSDGSLFYLPLYPYEQDRTPYVWSPGSRAWHALPTLPAQMEILPWGDIIVTPGANGYDIITTVLGVSRHPSIPGDYAFVAYYVARYQI
ncbi:MAG: sialidase family protein [Nitrososphaerota archaeon]